MDKITYQVRAEHWASAGNSEDGLFYRDQASIISSEHSSGFPSGSRNPKRQYRPGDIEFRFRRAPFTDWRHPGC